MGGAQPANSSQTWPMPPLSPMAQALPWSTQRHFAHHRIVPLPLKPASGTLYSRDSCGPKRKLCGSSRSPAPEPWKATHMASEPHPFVTRKRARWRGAPGRGCRAPGPDDAVSLWLGPKPGAGAVLPAHLAAPAAKISNAATAAQHSTGRQRRTSTPLRCAPARAEAKSESGSSSSAKMSSPSSLSSFAMWRSSNLQTRCDITASLLRLHFRRDVPKTGLSMSTPCRWTRQHPAPIGPSAR
mmetsp:Transcript_14148/g.40770  ORF Transcript_14148/g.40770 Transcript_14148/m.40770 type:complete len:241 (-) Transcript_14148:63-785(-)